MVMVFQEVKEDQNDELEEKAKEDVESIEEEDTDQMKAVILAKANQSKLRRDIYVMINIYFDLPICRRQI
jgi:hypothetical protein